MVGRHSTLQGHWKRILVILLTVLVIGLIVLVLNLRGLLETSINHYLKESLGETSSMEIDSVGLSSLTISDGVYPLSGHRILLDYGRIEFGLGINPVISLKRVDLNGLNIRLDTNQLFQQTTGASNEDRSLLNIIPLFSTLDYLTIGNSVLHFSLVGEDFDIKFGSDVIQNGEQYLIDARFADAETSLRGNLEVELSRDAFPDGNLQFDLFLGDGELQSALIKYLKSEFGVPEGELQINWERGYFSGLLDSTGDQSTTLITDIEKLTLQYTDEYPQILIDQLFGTYTSKGGVEQIDFGLRTNPFAFAEVSLDSIGLKGSWKTNTLNFKTERFEIAAKEFPVIPLAMEGSMIFDENKDWLLEISLSTGVIDVDFIKVEQFGLEIKGQINGVTIEATPIGLIGKSTFWLEELFVDFELGEDDVAAKFGGKLYNDLGLSLGQLDGEQEEEGLLTARWKNKGGFEYLSLSSQSGWIEAAYRFDKDLLNSLNRWYSDLPITVESGHLFGTFNRSTDNKGEGLVVRTEGIDLKHNDSELLATGLRSVAKFSETADGLKGNGLIGVNASKIGTGDWQVFDLGVQFSLEDELADIKFIEGKFLGGLIKVLPFAYSFENPNVITRIEFSRILASDLIAKFDETRYDVIGLLDGYIDLVYSEGRVIIKQAQWTLNKDEPAKVILRDTSILDGVLSFGGGQLDLKGKLTRGLSQGMDLSDLVIELVNDRAEEIDVRFVFSGVIKTDQLVLPLKNFTVHNRFNRNEIQDMIRQTLGISVVFD